MYQLHRQPLHAHGRSQTDASYMARGVMRNIQCLVAALTYLLSDPNDSILSPTSYVVFQKRYATVARRHRRAPRGVRIRHEAIIGPATALIARRMHRKQTDLRLGAAWRGQAWRPITSANSLPITWSACGSCDPNVSRMSHDDDNAAIRAVG